MPTDRAVDDDAVIWRYMSFVKFVSILAEHSLYFSRPFRFDDRWDGLFPPSYFSNTIHYAKEHGVPCDDFVEDFAKRRKRHRYGHFVNCWHISDHESDAMWRLYGLAPEGVAIQSTKRSVQDCLRPHNYGDVIYYEPNDSIRTEPLSARSDILWKRRHFSWEREFRVWFDDDDLLEKIERNEGGCEADLSPRKVGADQRYGDPDKETCGCSRRERVVC